MDLATPTPRLVFCFHQAPIGGAWATLAATGCVLDENTKHGGGFYYPYLDGVELRKMHPSYTPNTQCLMFNDQGLMPKDL